MVFSGTSWFKTRLNYAGVNMAALLKPVCKQQTMESHGIAKQFIPNSPA